MVATLANSQTVEAQGYLEEALLEAFISALSIMLGQPVRAEKSTKKRLPTGFHWFCQEFSPEAIGSIDFGVEKKAAISLGHKILNAGGLQDQDDKAALASVTDILTQVSGRVASALSVRLKSEVKAGSLDSSQPNGETPIQISVFLKDEELLLIFVSPSSILMGATSRVASTALVASSSQPAKSRSLDMLLDVKVPVSVVFGRTQLPLVDIVKLTSGSIIDLRRAVSEPVDIILNDSVIARGEIVVVDGYFAVRIKQITSKQERLHSLK